MIYDTDGVKKKEKEVTFQKSSIVRRWFNSILTRPKNKTRYAPVRRFGNPLGVVKHRRMDKTSEKNCGDFSARRRLLRLRRRMRRISLLVLNNISVF